MVLEGEDTPSVPYIDQRRAIIEEHLDEAVASIEPTALGDPMRHALLSGGKRVRPTLTVLSCEAVGGSLDDALEYAVGIELIHSASLVVDDIIDRAAIRRGVDSTWAAHDHDGALIGSHGLVAEALARFSRDPRALDRITDTLVELGEGEATELVSEPVTRDAYVELARRKTGALFRAAAEVGAIAGGGDPAAIDGLGMYAERVGVAFQIRDDVLDVVADVETLGKPGGRDADMERPSLLAVSDMDPDEADAFAREQSTIALEALDGVTIAEPAVETYLTELAQFVVTRER